ncbi:MAG: hypothetical protein H0W86_02570 [Armatimonadetes bacterium]|nr:hypothetical protein [Armatimonadota bacterium]
MEPNTFDCRLQCVVTLLAALSLVPLQNRANDLLLDVRSHYGGLKRFEATITHHNSSGLFRGDYEQHLVWNGKHTFELTVTKKSDFKPVAERPGSLAPDYRAKGGTLTTLRPNGTEDTSPLVDEPHTMPGWEVSGGPALTFLENTHNADFYFKPPSGFEVSLSMGAKKLWQTRAVREIVLDIKFEGREWKLSTFVDAKRPLFVGFAYDGGWMLYDNGRTVPAGP